VPSQRRKFFLSGLWQAQKDLLRILPEITYRTLMGRLPLGLRDIFFANGSAVVREILSADAENYPKSRQMYRALHPLVGDGIFISNGATWLRRRRMVNPAFENVRLRVAFPVMQAAVNDMLARLAAVADGELVNLDAEMAHVTADIIFRTIFSQPLTQKASRDVFDAFAQYQEALPHLDIVEILGMPDWIPRRSLRKAKRAAQPIREILRSMIEPRMRSGAVQQQDILGVLINSRDAQGGRFELEELVDEVAVLFLAGHETSASALSWAVYLASQQPDIEHRLAAEAGRILATGEARFEDINRLALTRNVFKEALRLYPPVSFITREAKEERSIGRWRVRRNSMMVVSPWVIHRHRSFWQQPDCFIPDRYDKIESSDTEKQAYLPFGSGPRSCPGASFAMLEGPLILASLFHHFRVVVAPEVDVQPICRLTTRPSNRILVHLRPRVTAPA